MEAIKFFKEQEGKHTSLYTRFSQQASRLAILRVLTFVIGTVFIIYFVNIRELTFSFLILIGAAIIFILFVKRHNKARFLRDQHRYLYQINQEEQSRLKGNLTSIETADEFNVVDHAYGDDLDVLGDNSLFQLLNRTSTYPGKQLLARRLLDLDKVINLRNYQESVKETANLPEFIQEYQALGRHVSASKDDFSKFHEWVMSTTKIGHLKWIKYMMYILPAMILLGIAIATFLSITYYIVLPLIIVNMVLLGQQHRYAQDVVEKTSTSLKMLRSFVHHIELVENQKFNTQLLKDFVSNFIDEEYEAKNEISNLASLLEQLQSRNSMLHIFFNIPLLLDIHWLIRIEQWQIKNKSHIDNWLNTLAEFEVLNSLAGQAFSQQTWVIPKTSEEPYFLKCIDLGHPLIPALDRVNNDFEMTNEGIVILLTGPNMAGKSTFLRTIGINLIMAKIGSVVSASEFQFNPDMKIFTAMRVKDNLSESVSSFYAELSRIKQLLTLAQKGESTLYFLDEVLKGTNSADRHLGAEALIRQLSKLGVSGFVSTHDLELGKISTVLKTVKNYSFESIVEKGKIEFDYKIREGVCQSFNACELMRQMGIEV